MASPKPVDTEQKQAAGTNGRRLLIAAAAMLVVGVAVNVGLMAWRAGYFAKPVPDMPATDHSGRPAKFSDLRGRWVVLFFGYTHCPDVCPQSLSDLSKAVKGLGPEAARVQPVFVSVDPERDTTKVLADYVGFYRSGLVGWRVEPGDLPAFTREFGATYGYGTGAASGTVEHPAVFYLLNPRGVLSQEPVYPPITADDLRDRLRAGK